MSKEIVELSPNELSELNSVLEQCDDSFSNEVDGRDIKLGYVSLMQSNSELVKDEKAKMKQYVDTGSGEVLSDSKDKLSFIVLDYVKVMERWLEVGDERKNFRAFRYASVPEDSRSFKVELEEGTLRQTVAHRFVVYVLNDKLLSTAPRHFTFSGGKEKQFAGSQLINRIEHNRNAGLRPIQQVYEASNNKVKNDKGSWFVPETSFSRVATKDEVLAAHKYMDLAKSVGSGYYRTIEYTPYESESSVVEAETVEDKTIDFV